MVADAKAQTPSALAHAIPLDPMPAGALLVPVHVPLTLTPAGAPSPRSPLDVPEWHA